MIRTLRRKFIAIAMLSLLGTLAVLCAAIGGELPGHLQPGGPGHRPAV